jgi:subtilisin family serine protease
MKLFVGKSDTIELQLVPLRSEVERGIRTFLPARRGTARAAFLANLVTAHTFEKSISSFATRAERAAVGAQKADTAVFRDPSGALRMVYREVVLRFAPGTPATKRKQLLDKYGLEVRTRNSFHSDQLIAYDRKRKYVAEGTVELSNKLMQTGEVEFAVPNFVSEFKKVAVPSVISEQWHLKVVDAAGAWGTTRGRGVTIAILDDGVDVDHPNLKPNIKRRPDPSEPRDQYGRDFFVGEDASDHFDPRPKKFQAPYDEMAGNDIHGTCCAGVAAASGSVSGVLGAAPEARILPVKIFHGDDLAVESRVADAIRYASRFADILSCSWGGARSPDIEAAINDAGAGRGGKGCPVFVATGNESRAQVSYPARFPSAIAVGASTDGEVRASYSNYGPEVSVVAPSDGGRRSIYTTDVSYPNRGFNLGTAAAGGVDGLHTNSFGGTSSATPLVAGIAALVLAANPNLTRDQVRTVLQGTAKKIGPAGSYNANGRSREYGYGRVDAAKAVARSTQSTATKAAGKTAKTAAKRARAAAKRAKARPRRPAKKPRRRAA